jgi:hypothetical protein
MNSLRPEKQQLINPQRFLNGEIHNWYKTVHGYSDHLVGYLLDKFEVMQDQVVLDPFCGTGTTLVECMKRGINCIGIDANPASCFISTVKTNWNINTKLIENYLDIINNSYPIILRFDKSVLLDSTYLYIKDSGMIRRGWINVSPLKKALAIKQAIDNLNTNYKYKNIFKLALLAEVVFNSSNMKFGPEIYCKKSNKRPNVFTGFSNLIEIMISDIEKVTTIKGPSSVVIQGDSRALHNVLIKHKINRCDVIITSPPYPSEHDYTRNSRLELAFLEMVFDRDSLREIKKDMIRSHTKGIYKEDEDRNIIKDNHQIQKIVDALENKIKRKTHGFARLYPTVVMEYFGGMKRHLISLDNVLAPGGRCAYVLGDQSCYLQVHIPTANILANIAKTLGYVNIKIEPWRKRWSTSTSRLVEEYILLFEKSK